MTLVPLEYLAAVDTWRHFATAAAKCFITQSLLSLQLQKIEAELGVQSVDRSKVPVVPTTEGVEIIQQARVILKEVERLSVDSGGVLSEDDMAADLPCSRFFPSQLLGGVGQPGTQRQRGTWSMTMQGMMPGMSIVLLSIIWLSASGLAMSGTPTEFVRQTTESILQVFDDPRLDGPGHREERLAQLRHIANSVFDWEEIARRVLATHWRQRTPQERQEFPELFRDAVQATYLERLEEAARQRLPERQAITYGKEEVDGPRAVVRTTIATKRQREIPLEYRLRQSDGHWRVYDVVILGVSVINNYRAQVQRIITQSSYEGLVQHLKARRLGEVFAEPPQPSR